MSFDTGYYDISNLFDMSTANVHTAGAEFHGEPTGAIEEHGEVPVVAYGVSRSARIRKGLLPGVDVTMAKKGPVSVYATSNAVMPIKEAGEITKSLLDGVAISANPDAVNYAFVKAMCLCMAMNSSSTLVPGRAKMYLGNSDDNTFDFFTDVMQPLGNDARRYFRAYADLTRGFLRDLQKQYQGGVVGMREELGDDASPEELEEAYDRVHEMWSTVMSVANNRGLTRCPDLVHDSAEYCTDLTAVELQFLKTSKTTIFATGAYRNLVDHPLVARTGGSSHVGAVGAHNSGGMPDDY